MTKYIALLRGINVGGNNKIAMAELKSAFENYGFKNVITYINSGNVIFCSTLDEAAVKTECEKLIEDKFGLEIAVFVVAAQEFCNAMLSAPAWWNRGNGKHNAIFVIPPMTSEKAVADMGEPKYEKVTYSGKVVFWSAPLETFSMTRWAQVVKHRTVYNAVTIRNANTALKLLELVK